MSRGFYTLKIKLKITYAFDIFYAMTLMRFHTIAQ